ncbi:MAG: uroporphyrinogen decarboxylase family protein [Nitrososphaerota archaeon]
MDPRKRVLNALEHKDVDIIPYWDGFSNMEAEECFLGKIYHEANDVEKAIFLARLFNSDIVNLPIAGFPGGPGVWCEVIYEGKNHIIAKNPFGGLQYWRIKPYFAIVLTNPIKNKEDLEKIQEPNIEKFIPRIKVFSEKLKKIYNYNYFTVAEIKGVCETPWMYLRGLKNFLIDIKKDPKFVNEMIELSFKFMMELTEYIIDEAPLDGIWMTDDMGDSKGPFFNIETYRKLFKPWHEEIVKRIHKKGKKILLHSHGNIMPLLEDIIDANFDSIDPLDPADNIDLLKIKEKYGDKITLMGGITKNIGLMSIEEIEKHVLEIAKIGSKKGFILMSAGGVPPEMSLEKFNHYRYIIEKARRI